MTERARILVLRYLSKFTFEIVPAALVSAIGGFLFAHYSAAPAPAARASERELTQAMQMVREEHAQIVDYLKAQQAAEQAALARADASAPAAREADAKAAPAHGAKPKRRVAERQAARIAQVRQAPVSEAAPFAVPETMNIQANVVPPPRRPLARVIAVAQDVKDGAVATAGRVAGWILPTGEWLLGRDTNALSAARRFISADSRQF